MKSEINVGLSETEPLYARKRSAESTDKIIEQLVANALAAFIASAARLRQHRLSALADRYPQAGATTTDTQNARIQTSENEVKLYD